MIESKFKTTDKVINPKKPEVVCTVTQVKLLCRGEPDERFVYNVLYQKDDLPRIQNDVPEYLMEFYQLDIF